MKKINLFAIAVSALLMLTSCSNEDSMLIDNQSKSLLKTYKVSRDATGAYSININVSDNVGVDNILDANSNTSKYFLFPSLDETQNNISKDVLIDDKSLKVAFVDTKSNKTENIYVEDDNIFFSAKSSGVKLLKDYSILNTEDGFYDLDFKVKNKTKVSFVYNENLKAHEIHLEESKEATEVNFSRSLEKLDGQSLIIHFVTHQPNTSATAKSELEMAIRKPIIIIDDGEDG